MNKEHKKRGFFDKLAEKLTGGSFYHSDKEKKEVTKEDQLFNGSIAVENFLNEDPEAELVVDAFQTDNQIVIQTMLAGIKPEELQINISRDSVSIIGKREDIKTQPRNHFIKELYWGKFSRFISLPHEVEPDESEAIEKHGLLTIKIQKLDKNKKSALKVKSI